MIDKARLDYSGNVPVWYYERQYLQNFKNVHDAGVCRGRACTFHNRTDHPLRQYTMNWRADRGIMERICPCGIGHPDPDQFAYWAEIDEMWQRVHGCCGVHCV
jgi:hypothetical protein